MSHRFISQIESTGPGDLVSFRDTVLTYCAALREKQPFLFQGSPEAGALLSWLGVEYENGKGEGVTYLDPSRANGKECRLLASGTKLPHTSLSDFRDGGYLGTTLFAALVRSSYGPDEPGYYPTRSELGFYFQESELRQETRWDEEYLEECQAFFFEELTPAELVGEVFHRLGPSAAREGAPFKEALEGVAFLIGEQTQNLLPLTRFFEELLVSTEPFPGPACGSLPVETEQLLQACGPELLSWRASR